MNKKNLPIVLLLAILAVSVGGVLLLNGSDEFTNDWGVQSVKLVKQYLKLLGFLSVIGLVYIRIKRSKTNEIEE